MIGRGVADIPATRDFQPGIATVTLKVFDPPEDFESLSINGSYKLEIDPDGKLPQITTRNDERYLTLNLTGTATHELEGDGEKEDGHEPGSMVWLLVLMILALSIIILTVNMWHPEKHPALETAEEELKRIAAEEAAREQEVPLTVPVKEAGGGSEEEKKETT